MTSETDVEPAKKANCANLDKRLRDLVGVIASLTKTVKELQSKNDQQALQIGKLVAAATQPNEQNEKSSVTAPTVSNVTASKEAPRPKLSTMSNKIAKASMPLLYAAVQEQHEIKKRAHNVVIVGLPESSETEPVKIKQHDLNEVQHILEVLDVVTDNYSTKRLPKTKHQQEGSLIVTFTNENNVGKVLKLKKELKSHSYHSKVFINPDMTRNQRTQDFELRKSRAELNRKLGPTSPNRAFIRSNKIVLLDKDTRKPAVKLKETPNPK